MKITVGSPKLEKAWFRVSTPVAQRRKQLDSDVVDISNLGGSFAGCTTAALFLQEFVGEKPWAHIDIAGTMSTDADDSSFGRCDRLPRPAAGAVGGGLLTYRWSSLSLVEPGVGRACRDPRGCVCSAERGRP
ncbi:hypothetical protein [Micropruina glycogenica]|nr:hypothetical protein [Micropruina glycogenica]